MASDARDTARATFGRLLKQYRDAKDISQAALADKLKISSGVLSRWESGKNLPQDPLEQIEAIGTALDLSSAEKWQLLGAAGYKQHQASPESVDFDNPAVVTLSGALNDQDVPRIERDRFATQVVSLIQIWTSYQKRLPRDVRDYKNLSQGLNLLFDHFARQLYEAAGDAHVAEYDYQTALLWYAKAEFARSRIGDGEDAATLAIKRGDAWRSLFNRDEALSCYKSAENTLEEAKSLTFAEKMQRLTAKRKQASVYLITQQDLVKDATQAESLLKSTQEGLEQLIDASPTKEGKKVAAAELSKTLNFLGWTNALLDNPKAAYDYRIAALEHARVVGDPHLLTLCNRLAGDDSRNQENLEDASNYYAIALKHSSGIADANEQTRETAHIKRGMGNICIVRQQWEDAKTHLEESRKAFEEVGDRTRTANVLNDLGNLYAAMEGYTKAEDFLLQARIDFDALGNKYYMNSARLDMAEVCIQQDDISQAVQLVKEVEESIISTPYRPLLLRVLELQAYLAILQGKPDVLIDAAYKRLCELAQDGNSQRVCKKHAKRYEFLLTKRGDFERAAVLLDHLIEAVDELPGLRDLQRDLEAERVKIQKMHERISRRPRPDE